MQVDAFVATASSCSRIIVSERTVPNASKSIQPVDVGGVAGGEKFISHGIFFKVITAEARALYGGEDAAMKAAGHELKGSRAFLSVGVGTHPRASAAASDLADAPLQLRTPLMALIDYGGCRLVACSLLPVSGSTLKYGSADAGRTVHRDAAIASAMAAAGRVLNLKPHLVGPPSAPVEVVGPCDIEVHAGRDGRFYVRMGQPTWQASPSRVDAGP